MIDLSADILNAPSDGRVRIAWTGNAGWLLAYNETLLAVDPDLEPQPSCPYRVTPPPFTPEQLAPRLDLALYTHNHGDHFNTYTAQRLLEGGNCLLAAPASCVELEIPAERRLTPVPRQPFTFQGIGISPLRALHGHQNGSVYKFANLHDCGYVFDFGGLRLMIPGDTVLLHDHEEVGKVNVLMVSPTEHNTWIRHSALLVAQTDPDYIFPQHYATFEERSDIYFWTHGYVEELRDALPEPYRNRYHPLVPGACFVL